MESCLSGRSSGSIPLLLIYKKPLLATMKDTQVALSSKKKLPVFDVSLFDNKSRAKTADWVRLFMERTH
ncbi:MAG: hypothetical protein U0T32_01280 [Chitinophagales bacterium]